MWWSFRRRWFGVGFHTRQVPMGWTTRYGFHARIGSLIFEVHWGGFD